MHGGNRSKCAGAALIIMLGGAALLGGCTLSAGSDDNSNELRLTATLSVTQPATLAAAIQTGMATRVATYTPTNPSVLIIEPTVSAALESTITLAPTDSASPTHTPTVEPSSDPDLDPDIDATVVALLDATNTAATFAAAVMPTVTVTATMTPPPTAIPPTRTHPGPPTVIPFDDGSGDLIPGTGGSTSTTFSPIPGLAALPHTLYYLSDAGSVNQVFRLQIGLPYPEQLTYSATGVWAFDVAPDGTLAYITGQGEMVIGGLPFLTPPPDSSIIDETRDILLGDGTARLQIIHAADLPFALGIPYWFDSLGTQYDLTPLTGLVGSPQWGPTFKKNDQARVHIEADPLNVRATPGGKWIASLTDGVEVLILAGPVEQDGYTWWQIRVANGVTGWSVEAVIEEDGSRLQTLQPVAK
ncbi:MAG: hypothetical protein JXA10_00845 [Anaerolineae bacterium]|nr:hypothetical protein [Anaerolineae bacterium]